MMYSKRAVAARGVLQLLLGSSRTVSVSIANQRAFSVVNVENVCIVRN
jgi:hypothetical protein